MKPEYVGEVPRLDLAPRRTQPLSLWNPRDYITFLYWCFFFPQALRWYTATFGAPSPQYRSWNDLLKNDETDSVLRRFFAHGLVAALFISTGSSCVLHLGGIPVNWVGVALGVFGGFSVGLFVGTVVGSGISFAIGDEAYFAVDDDGVFTVTSSIGAVYSCGVSGGITAGTILGIAFGIVTEGAIFGTAIGCVLFVVVGIGVGVGVGGVIDGVAVEAVGKLASGAVVSIVVGIFVGIGAGMAMGPVEGIALGSTWICSTLVFACRAFDWLIALPLWSAQPLPPRSRMTWLAMPGSCERIESWLELDWASGLANIDQILAYSLQFVPAVGALERALAHSPPEVLLTRTAAAAAEPYDWGLVRYSSAPLGDALRVSIIEGISFLPSSFRKAWAARYPISLRLDTPAHAACAGFWLLHEKDASGAAVAFSHVRDLLHGEELVQCAETYAAAQAAGDLAALAAWKGPARLANPSPPKPLRPDVLASLATLRSVAEEAAVAVHARASLLRSAALGRAAATLQELIRTLPETCPEPEWPILQDIARKWLEIVIAAGGVAGQEVLRQPMPNPYAGYSGLPVQPPAFVGRVDIFRRIESLWAGNDRLPALFLYGHRRMGKTSILRNLESLAGREILLVYLTMQDSGFVDDTGELLLDLAEAVHERVAKAGLDAGLPPNRPDFDHLGTARRALNDLLKRLDPQMAGRRLVLAIDEFELVEEGIGAGRLDSGLPGYLRSLIQNYPWLGLIFGGLHTLDEMGRDYQGAFYGGQAEHVRVGYMSYEETVHLLTQPHPDFALDLSQELLDELYRLTWGQPYLLQRLAWELVNRWNDRFQKDGETTPRTLQLEDLAPILTDDLYAGAAYYFDGVWTNVTSEERQAMTALAAREEPWAPADLASALGWDLLTLEPVLARLRQHDVIPTPAEGLRFASELMRRWVVRENGGEQAS